MFCFSLDFGTVLTVECFVFHFILFNHPPDVCIICMLLPDITCDAGVVNPAVAIEEYIAFCVSVA
jgi:hypothetical protein